MAGLTPREVEDTLDRIQRQIDDLSRDADMIYEDILHTLKVRLEDVEVGRWPDAMEGGKD